MVGIDSAETAEQARFAIELYAIGALYVLGLIAFLLQRSGGAWWLVLGMQMGVFVLALIEGMLTDMGWVFFSGLPLLSGLLLFAFLNARRYVELGWLRDKGVRDTGPYINGKYYGTHPAVRVYYSPGVMSWLMGGRGP